MTTPIINLEQLVTEHAGLLQQLSWQRIIQSGMATELLTQQTNNQLLRSIIGTMLLQLGGTYTITVAAMQAFAVANVEAQMVSEAETHNWLLSLVAKKV